MHPCSHRNPLSSFVLCWQPVARKDTGRLDKAKYDDVSKFNDVVVTHANWYNQLVTMSETDIPIERRRAWKENEQAYAEMLPDPHLAIREVVHDGVRQAIDAHQISKEVRRRS